jgi:hypothetical protein
MFPFGARVMTRNGTLGKVVRQINFHPPYQYLIEILEGEPRILFDDDLRMATDVEQGPGNAIQRRQDIRRKRERRSDVKNPKEQLTPDRRMTDRRHAERRWIVDK